MELNEKIIEFINNIIDLDETLERKQELISKFAEYLVLTKIVDDETIEVVNRIIVCLPEIISLKEKLGNVDIVEITKNTKDKPKKKTYKNKHYNHYSNGGSYSSSCDSSSSKSSSCGTSYSSSCGVSGTRNNRC